MKTALINHIKNATIMTLESAGSRTFLAIEALKGPEITSTVGTRCKTRHPKTQDYLSSLKLHYCIY